MTLVQSALPPVSSCLIKNQGEQLSSSMKRAILEVWIISVIFIIFFSRRDLYKDTVNLLLFTCEKYSRGLRVRPREFVEWLLMNEALSRKIIAAKQLISGNLQNSVANKN